MNKRIILAVSALLLSGGLSFAQKFGFVNTDYILDNIPEYKEAQHQLDQISVQWQKEIEAKYAEIDKLYKSYQAEQILLTEDMKRKREQQIVDKEKEAKDLQKQRFGQGGDLFKKRQELIKPMQEKVYNAVKKIAEDGSYAFIFDKASDSLVMLYANAKYDKSEDVLRLLGYKVGKAADTKGK